MPTLTPDLIEEAARVSPDRTLATSFLPPDARGRVISLVLFANEIARARAVVSEPGLAAIRLQWWRDTLDQIYGGTKVRAQPIATALSQTIQEATLPRLYFDAMIDAHELELTDFPFADWAQLDAYLDATHGHLNRLCLLASGLVSLSTSMDGAARQCGIAWGLTQLLISLPQWCLRRACWLPEDVRNRLDLDALFAGKVDEPANTAFAHVLTRIDQARRDANTHIASANLGSAFPALSHACLAKTYAHKHVPLAHRPWRQPVDPSLFERQLRLVASVARGRI
jgi:phytoene/squalene synthetase